jgi:hypothetical protein
MIDTVTQRHLLSVSTSTTGLGCIGRVDLYEPSASFFRFAGQLQEKGRPCGISYRFSQAMVVDHTINGEVFDADEAKAVNNLPTLLMREVFPSPCNTLMDTRHSLAMFATLKRPFCQFRVFSLDFGKGFFFLAKEAGILDFFFIREGGKGFQPHVNTDLLRAFWQPFWFTLNGKAHVPFTGAASPNGAGLDLPLDWTVIDHLDRTDLRETHTVIMGDAETGLWIGDGVVASMSFKSGVSRLFTCFDAAEERFVCQINTHGNILQDLGMDGIERRALFFQYRIRGLLSITGQTFAVVLPCIFTHLKQMVVQPTTLFKGLVEHSLLFLRRIDSILKSFTHEYILA